MKTVKQLLQTSKERKTEDAKQGMSSKESVLKSSRSSTATKAHGQMTLPAKELPPHQMTQEIHMLPRISS